jgi:hypothetical protein
LASRLGVERWAFPKGQRGLATFQQRPTFFRAIATETTKFNNPFPVSPFSLQGKPTR